MSEQPYLVLARKYRPTTFAELVGQDHVVRTLQNAIRKEKIGHAYIFSGTRGVGKTTAARLLAKAVNCEKGPAPEPCNECSSCREIGEGRSLDVIEIDGASNRGIDEVRQLRENVKFATSHARYKVYIIDEVHMLTDPAFNALLKTLEEPPAHVKFIMATTSPDKVPATIQSRCQRFDFRLLSREEIVGQLEIIIDKEGYKLNRNALNEISRAAEGSLRDAQGLLEQVISFAGENPEAAVVEEVLHLVKGEVLNRFIRGVAKRDAAELIRVIDDLASRGFEMRSFLRELIEWIRGMLLVRVSPELADLIPLVPEDRKLLAELAAGFSRGRLQALIQTAIEAESELKASSTPRYVMEMVSLKMADTADFDTLADLTGRMEELSRKMAGAKGGTTTGRKAEIRDRKPDPGEAADIESGAGWQEPEEEAEQPGESGEDLLELTGQEEAGSALPDEWERFLDEVKKRKIGLGSFLEHGKVISRDEQDMVIGFDRENRFFYESAQENNHPAVLKEVGADFFGDGFRVRLQLIEEDGGEEKMAADRSPQQTDLMKKKRREALKSPLVQEIIDKFGGQVLDVKIL